MVATLVQIRTALLRQRQRELERQVAERTAELSITQAQLRHFAYVDMLTGLPNRRAFTEEFRRMLDEAQLTRARLALLLIDMDGFKQVNDTLGHHAGDALLVAVGGRLRGAVREGDFVARLGGDEFAVLMMLEDDVIELVCQRIIDGFGPAVAIEGQNLVAGASIGVAVYPDHGGTQERIYKMADVAMYAAKRDGRGTWRCFEGTMQAA
jgi:diguanylate cyclase (GGDEF)-like protein